VPVHESSTLVLRHRLIRKFGQRLEVLFARRSGGEKEQHRGRSGSAEAVYPALRHEEEVTGMRGAPAAAVVQLHLAVEDEERLGNAAVKVWIGPAARWSKGSAVEPKLAASGGSAG
jgi:hypothetical protein